MLLDFLQEAQLDRVGCFPYSSVDGAAANALPNPVPEELRQERRDRLMSLQADISAERLAARIGQSLTVLVDEITDDAIIARSYADAPEIDGVVIIENDIDDVAVGDMLTVTVVDSGEYDLWAELSDA